MRILAAVDLPQGDDAVLKGYADWAARLDATLDLVHVDETPSIVGYVHDPVVRDIALAEQEKLVGENRSRLEMMLDALPAAVRGRAVYLQGNPASVILDQAADYDALAVATHGRTGLAHLWLGSVAEKIVRASPVPVLVLRLPKKG